MHIAPFIFKIDRLERPIEFMGYLTYKNSRRNKDDIRVYINTGQGNEFVLNMPVEENKHKYLSVFAFWAYEHGHMDDWFDTDFSLPCSLPANFAEDDFLKFLKTHKAELRFW